MFDEIINSKWEDGMPTVPSGTVDLIITSPPYNVNLGNNKHKKDKYASYDDNMPYDEYLDWITNLFTECNRVLKTGGRLCINIGDGANGSVPTHVDFTYRLLNLNQFVNKDKLAQIGFEPFQMMTTIVWNKQQIGASTAWGSFQSPSCPSFPTPFEFIIVVAKGTTKHEGDKSKISISKDNFITNSRALWTFPPETQMMKKYDHPAMFPEELPRRLIDHLTYEGDVVLDPFSGAGTTCAVAKKMKRRYIGFEMSQKYYDKSLSRLAEIPRIIETIIDGKKVDLPDWLAKV
jgi:site-specific DNA-methyltransferase (adenine-specific)